MTEVTPSPQALSAYTVLFGSRTNGAAALSGMLASAELASPIYGATKQLADFTRELAAREVGSLASTLLDVDLTTILITGWRKHSALLVAARRTMSAPGTREWVELLTHQVQSIYRPAVELFVDDVRVATVNFELTLTFQVHPLVAGISFGRLTSLRFGDCDLAVCLALADTPVAERRKRLSLPAVVHLGNGVPLLGTEPADAAPPPYATSQ